MPDRVVELYSDADALKLKRKIKIWVFALLLAAAAALAVCSAFAATATTLTAEKAEVSAILTSTFSGWVIIYCAIFVVGSTRRELSHAATLRTSERERVEGKISFNGERLRIKKSISARGVTVETADGAKKFWVAESRAGRLKEANASAVYISHGYVAAYEAAK